MSKAYAVIGLNYGDEGKGLTTDYLCRTLVNPIVVRFSGGANAGHTVVTPKGSRHVFSHFGSGSLAGVPTYWSQYAITNPILFNKEYTKLDSFYDVPDVIVSLDSPVTTPIDMLANQYEERRRTEKQSTCGVGIHNTVNRERFVLSLKVSDIINIVFHTDAKEKMKAIFDRQLAYYNISNEFEERIVNNMAHKFIAECKLFLMRISTLSFEEVRQRYNTIIFEGSQGLGLSSNRLTDPRYLTEAITDMTNIKAMWGEELTVFGVTRRYLTRHGNGYLENEVDEKPFHKIKEETNVTNEWQGKFRYGILTPEVLKRNWEYLTECSRSNITYNLMMTCLDQVGSDQQSIITDAIDLVKDIPYNDFYGSFGAISTEVKLLNKKGKKE